MRPLVLSLIPLSVILPRTLGAQQTTIDCKRPLVVDIAAKSVAGFRLDVSDSVLEATVPNALLRKTVDTLEGDSSITYGMELCGHTVHVGWNGFRVSDSAFVTTDGLRVGMPVSRFDDTWGQGQLLWSESGYLRYYYLHGVALNLGVDNCVSLPSPGAEGVLDRDCRVAFLWVGTPSRVTRVR
jgi:hypothetical protein